MFLRKIDMLSPKITLYYKQKNTHASIISGILTIIACLFIFSFGIIYFAKYIRKENPTAYYFNRYIEDVGTFSFKDLYFFNYIQLIRTISRQTVEMDFNKIEIIGVNVTIDNYADYGENISHWIYGKCDNEINIKGIEHLLNKETFYKSACLKKFYNNKTNQYYDINDNKFEWPDISHGASHHNTSYYGVIIKKCFNSTFRIKNFGLCSSETEITNYLYNAYLSFNILDHNIDLLNYKNPITNFFYAVTNALSKDSYIINNLNYNPGLIRTIDSVFLESALEQSIYFFHENSKTTTILENTDILCAFYIWMQNSQQFYERRYKKLQDLLSEIGGFANLIMMIAYCINYLIARFNMLIDTKELISNIIKKDISIYENIVKKQSLKKYIDGNNNKQNEDNSNINIIESEDNQNIIINKENIDKGKDKDKKIIINRINVINSNKGEETNRMNKKDDFIEKEIVKIHKSRTFAKIRRMSTKKLTIKRDFASISDNDFFSCFSYFFYIMFCKRNNSKIKYYEELRRLIISEECMIQNYLNIYKLLEAHNFH